MRMAGESPRQLASRRVPGGRVPSAFHLMREAAAESPGLPLCAAGHGRRRDRPGRSGEKPALRHYVGTRLHWRIAPRLVLRIATTPGEVQRWLGPRLPSIQLTRDRTSFRPCQKAGALMDSAESRVYAACANVRDELQHRHARK